MFTATQSSVSLSLDWERVYTDEEGLSLWEPKRKSVEYVGVWTQAGEGGARPAGYTVVLDGDFEGAFIEKIIADAKAIVSLD